MSRSIPETRELPCQLTPEERDEFANRNAQAVDELRKLEAAKKESAAQYGQMIKEKRVEVNELCDCAITGIEYRPISVYDETDRARGLCETIRSDTGEVIKTRHLTPAELQMQFDDMS